MRSAGFTFFVGWRYVRARRSARFLSVVSAVAIGGLALGVIALVLVLSVMNGFDAELRSRILALMSQIEVRQTEGSIADWRALQARLDAVDGVVAAAPAVGGTAMLSTPGIVRGVQLRGIDPIEENAVSGIDGYMRFGRLEDLRAGGFGIVLGSLVARALGVNVGDELTVMLPEVSITPAGVYPRMRRFTVVGVFSVGAQVDGSSALIHLDDGARLYRLGNDVEHLRVAAQDADTALSVAASLRACLGPDYSVSDWSQTQGSLFSAVQMEKRMVSLLLMVIVAVAAFNIVSILTMVVSEKRAAIAVLRTMGASPGQIQAIFMVQGLLIALIGIGLGLLIGLPLAFHVGEVVAWLEAALGFRVFNPGIYFISYIPSVVQRGDVVTIVVVALVLSVVATLWPARRAARIGPAEVLRYE